MKCPNCGTQCERDEVDVGVVTGPWGCFGCGWSQDTAYDRSMGTPEAEKQNPGHYADPCGGLLPHTNIKKGLARLGVDPSGTMKDTFNEGE